MKKANPGNELTRNRHTEPGFANTRHLAPLFAKVVVIFLLLSLYLVQSLHVSNLKYQIRKLGQDTQALMKKNTELRIQVARVASAERIEKIYRLKYGYVPVASTFRIKTLSLPGRALPKSADCDNCRKDTVMANIGKVK